jgi:hypothetical protein
MKAVGTLTRSPVSEDARDRETLNLLDTDGTFDPGWRTCLLRTSVSPGHRPQAPQGRRQLDRRHHETQEMLCVTVRLVFSLHLLKLAHEKRTKTPTTLSRSRYGEPG